MDARRDADLLLGLLLPVLAALAWALDAAPWVRAVVGVPLLVFLPGYALLALLFPARRDPGDVAARGLDVVQRVGLSVGLSVALVVLLGIALDRSPWGVQQGPVLGALAGLTVLLALLALRARVRLPPEQRPAMPRLAFPDWQRLARRERAIAAAALACLLASGAVAGYVLTRPPPAQAYTEFALLDAEGGTRALPTSLEPGEQAQVLLRVVSHEGRFASFRVVALDQMVEDGNFSGAPRTLWEGELSLQDGESWARAVDFTLDQGRHRLAFQLWRADATEVAPYRELHLWVQVRAA